MLALSARHPKSGSHFLSNIRNGSSVVWWSIVGFALLSLLGLVAQFFDYRLLHGVSVWDKPTKFFAALVIQFATVSWALMMLPLRERNSRSMGGLMVFMVGCGWFEMAYMVFRASRGEASHFNTAEPVAAIFYGLMGVAAVSMIGIAFFVGVRLWRHRRDSIWTEAAALGLMAGAALGGIAGAYMSAQTSHWVGGDHSDATGLAFFSWSTTGGDLRVAHFVGLHAAQFIPFAALSGRRWLVWATGILISILTVLTFAMAMTGLPLLRWA